MLEIVFDETENNCFLGEAGKLVNVDFAKLKNWQDYRLLANEILKNNVQERIVIVEKLDDEDVCNNLALALSVEDYFEIGKIETIVFKVADSGAAMSSYRPLMALANSLRYARDLYRLSDKEMYADIKRLGYLGLKISENYLQKEIKLVWQGAEPQRLLMARNKTQAIIMVGILKTWAICKEKFKACGIIYLDKEYSEEIMDENEIVTQIINYVRKENGN